MKYRIEHDTMGEVKIPAEALWGPQTQRSFQNFEIGDEIMPWEIINAFAYVKSAAAQANNVLKPKKMTVEKCKAITEVCDAILDGAYMDQFPLSVWQTGSGTQSNMNVNEVIANVANMKAGKKLLHPNDDVNMSQSSNDTFPTALNIACVLQVYASLLPAVADLIRTFEKLEKANKKNIKTGRTHLQDAVPISFAQEISGWRAGLQFDRDAILEAVDTVCDLAMGGTAVGTGLNCPKGFDSLFCEKLTDMTGISFQPAANKFEALSMKNEIVFLHGALKSLAADLMKIANDVRWLSSGPRCGLGEIFIPENEPGSSIMPGKVNPTQCESLTMVAVQVMGNDAAISFAASQGNFELNVFMPVIAYNFIQSANLLADGIRSFTKNCAQGIRANEAKMKENLDKSLMLVTALNTHIGYENAAKVAKLAHKENISLKEAAIKLELLTGEEFDRYVKPEKMV